MDDVIEWLESDDIFLIKYGFVIANTFTLIFLYLIKKNQFAFSNFKRRES